MNVSDYRKQVEEQIRQAAEQQPTYRDILSQSKSAASSDMALEAAVAPPNEVEVASVVDVARDKSEDPELRTSALQILSDNISENPDQIDTLLGVLQDEDNPPPLRLSALRLLQQLSFDPVLFNPKRPDFLAVLRSIIDDQNAELRGQAIAVLANAKDEYVQRRLIEGLEGSSKALVPDARAIQLLGYDIHADYYPLLRQIIKDPPSRVAKIEAIRLLASDTSSKDLLAEIFRDKKEHPDVRRASALALQSLAPAEFEEEAKRVVLDEDEDPKLRATCMTVLTHFANPASLTEDSEFNTRVEQLGQHAKSRHLKKATTVYRSKYGV